MQNADEMQKLRIKETIRTERACDDDGELVYFKRTSKIECQHGTFYLRWTTRGWTVDKEKYLNKDEAAQIFQTAASEAREDRMFDFVKTLTGASKRTTW